MSAPIPFNSTAAAVAAILQAIPSIGSDPPGITCGGGPLPGTAVSMTFAGPLSQGDQPALVADSTGLTGGTATVTTTTPGTGYKAFTKIAIPGKWRAFDPSQSGANARQWRFDYSAVRDPVLATMARIQLMNARATGSQWGNT